MTIRRLTVVLASGALLLPCAASAQEDGVFDDPDSPANEEYVIPGEDARDQADPNRDRGARGGPPRGPAFGSGVGEGGGEADDGSGGESSGESGGQSSGESDRKRRERAEDPNTVDDDARDVLIASGSDPVPDGGGNTLLAILGSAALVVLLGAGGGALMRRRGRGP